MHRVRSVSTSSMRSIYWLNFLDGPKTNSELGRKRRKIEGTQFSFALADDAEITISFSLFSGPAHCFYALLVDTGLLASSF